MGVLLDLVIFTEMLTLPSKVANIGNSGAFDFGFKEFICGGVKTPTFVLKSLPASGKPL